MSDIAAQSKRTTPREKFSTNIDIEPDFDGSEYIAAKKNGRKRSKTSENEKSNVQQPRQPKKERSLTSQSDQVNYSSYRNFILIFFFLVFSVG